MQQHWVAAGAWTLLVAGGIGFGAVTGFKKSRHATMKEEVAKVIALGKAGRLLDAEEAFQGLAVRYPDEPSVWLNLGIAQRGLHRLPEAAKTFARVNELDPQDYDALAERASIQKLSGDVEGALTFLEEIPAGEGRVRIRLLRDRIWQDISGNPRMQALRAKHGLQNGPDTSTRIKLD